MESLAALVNRGFYFQAVPGEQGEIEVVVGSYGWHGYYDRIHVWGEDEAVAARELSDHRPFSGSQPGSPASLSTPGIDWNTTDTADIDACEDYIVNTLAPHIAAFDSYPGSSAIPQGTQALVQVWNGDARLGISESPDPDKWQWVLGSPTTELWMDNWAFSASAPHPEAAHAFINYVLTPENALAELDYIGYHTGAKDIQAAAEAEGVEMLDFVFFTPEQLATMKDGEVNEAQERTIDIWNKAKAAAGA